MGRKYEDFSEPPTSPFTRSLKKPRAQGVHASACVCACSCVGEKVGGIQDDFLDACASVWQIKFECKCSGISWQSVIKTLLCLMICFVNMWSRDWSTTRWGGCGGREGVIFKSLPTLSTPPLNTRGAHVPAHAFIWEHRLDEKWHSAASPRAPSPYPLLSFTDFHVFFFPTLQVYVSSLGL